MARESLSPTPEEENLLPEPQVGIIMGSDSDLSVMQEAAAVLEQLDISYEITIVSAHRTPRRMFDYATSAHERKLKVIIAGAGGAAHLPGMVASLTHVPVIGVPVEGKRLDGLDSLLSIVQMPPGVPVGTMAVNGAKNAGLFAAEILATSDESLAEKLKEYKAQLESEVMGKVEVLNEEGYTAYLASRRKPS